MSKQILVRWMIFGMSLSCVSAFADMTSAPTNTNVASCCDSCYLKGTPGAVPCHPGLEKTVAAPTSPDTSTSKSNTAKSATQ